MRSGRRPSTVTSRSDTCLQNNLQCRAFQHGTGGWSAATLTGIDWAKILVMSEREASGGPEVVREWFEGLNDTFGAVVRGEQAGMGPLVESYAAPVTITNDDEYQVLVDSPSILGYLNGVVNSLRQADYDHTVIHRLDVRLLNARSAIIDLDVSRVNLAGDEIARFGATEIANRTNDGWRISAVMIASPPS